MDKVESFLLILLLLLIYSLIFILFSFRMLKISEFSNNWVHTKMFYRSIWVQIFLRLCSFGLIIWSIPKSEDTAHSVLFLLISLPDSFALVSYYLLALQTLSIFYNSHMESSINTSLLLKFTKARHREESRVTATIIVIWVIIQSLIYSLYSAKEMNAQDVTIEMAVANISSGTAVLTIMLLVFNKFAGVPLNSNLSRTRLSIILKRNLLWTLGRYIKGASDLYESKNNLLFLELFIEKEGNFWIGIVLFVILILCEILCYLSVIDYSFMSIFLIREDIEDLHISPYIQQNFTINAESINLSIIDSDSPRIDFNEIKIKEKLPQKEDRLGVLYTAQYQDKEVLIREIYFSRISGYILEDLDTEIGNLKALDCEYVLPMIGLSQVSACLYIVTQYMDKRSLFDQLHSNSGQISNPQKLHILREIAKAISESHFMNFYHGHLSSHNILLDRHFSVKISDGGLVKLRKYAGIVFGHSNKNAWTSPQLLKDPSKVVHRPSPSDDVFSFGIIAWEICTGMIPHTGLSRGDLQKYVGHDGYVPEIPDSVPPSLSKAIKSCWHYAPELRPTIFSLYSDIASIDWD